MSYLISARNNLMRTLLSRSISSTSAIPVHPDRFNPCYQQYINSILLVARCSFSTGSNVTPRQVRVNLAEQTKKLFASGTTWPYFFFFLLRLRLNPCSTPVHAMASLIYPFVVFIQVSFLMRSNCVTVYLRHSFPSSLSDSRFDYCVGTNVAGSDSVWYGTIH